MTAVGYIAQNLLALVSRLVWLQSPYLAEGVSAVASESRVIGTYAGGLHTQCETGEAVVVDLKGLLCGLSQLGSTGASLR